MSGNRQAAGSDQHTKKPPVFRKSDFVIRNKQDDSFSQIDSFKVTAKKPALPDDMQNNAHFQSQGFQQQMQGFAQSHMFHNYPIHMSQGLTSFPSTQGFGGQIPQTQSNWITGQMNMHPSQGQMHLMQGQMHPSQGQMHPSQGQMHPSQGQMHLMQGQMHSVQTQMYPVQGQISGQAHNFQGHGYADFSAQSQSLSGFQMNMTGGSPQSNTVADVPHHVQQTNSIADSLWQFPGGSTQRTTPTANQLSAASVGGQLLTSGSSQTSASCEFSDFSAFAANTVESTPLEDDFQEFSAFDKPASQAKSDFAEFSAFAESPTSDQSPNLFSDGPLGSYIAPSEKGNNVEESFGDFSAFSESIGPTITSPDTSKVNLSTTNQPLGGKRINIVVKKNLAASGASLVSSRGSSVSPNLTRNSRSSNISSLKRKTMPGPGLGDLALTLSQATSQLSGPKPPPPLEEQRDFSILQEVVSSIGKTTPQLQTKQPDSPFVLPTTPTKVAEIFPRCAPKKPLNDNNDDSFQEFADFSEHTGDFGGAVDTLKQQSQHFEAVNLEKPPGVQNNTVQEDFGGFADFSSVPGNVTETNDGFGDFSSTSHISGELSSVNAGVGTEKPPGDNIKSHSVDWSAFSALDILRAEEEEGNLGDFSVFGSTLKPVIEEPQHEQPNYLVSPEHKPSNHQLDFLSSSNQEQPDLFASGLQPPTITDVEDDWADFKASPAQNAGQADTPLPHTEDGWAAFSEAAPAHSELTPAHPDGANDFQAFAQIPPASDTMPQKKFDIDVLSTGSADEIKGLPRVSSASFFDQKHSMDIITDNDSDWSGFAVQAAIQEDNVSSDWSFKDNASHDAKSVASGAFTTDSSKPDSDRMSFEANPPSDLSGIHKIDESESTAGDEWEAFGAINRSKQPISSEIEAGYINLVGNVKPVDDGKHPKYLFTSSSPPLSPDSVKTPDKKSTPPAMSGIHWDSSQDTPTVSEHSQSEKTLTETESGAEAEEDEWSAFGGVPAPVNHPSTTTNHLRASPASRHSSNEPAPHQLSPPPIDDDSGDDWGDFGTNAIVSEDNTSFRDQSESPIAFSPPPLSDGDFSPAKVARPESDWFSFSPGKENLAKLEQSLENQNDLGTFASLPEHVMKLSVNDEAKDLSKPAVELEPENKLLNDPTTQHFPDINQSPNSVNTINQLDEEKILEDDSFDFHEPPPFPETTPGDEEMPPFPGESVIFDHVGEDDFAGFQFVPGSSPQNTHSESFSELPMSFRDQASPPHKPADFKHPGGTNSFCFSPKSPESSSKVETAASEMCGNPEYPPVAVPQASVDITYHREGDPSEEWDCDGSGKDVSIPVDMAEEGKKDSHTMDEDDWEFPPKDSIVDEGDDDWGFPNETTAQYNGVSSGSSSSPGLPAETLRSGEIDTESPRVTNIPDVTSIIDEADEEGDGGAGWGFQTADAAADNDEWTFGSAPPPAAPPPTAPAADSASTPPSGNIDDFGDFPDDDDFQEFGDSAFSEPAPVSSPSASQADGGSLPGACPLQPLNAHSVPLSPSQILSSNSSPASFGEKAHRQANGNAGLQSKNSADSSGRVEHLPSVDMDFSSGFGAPIASSNTKPLPGGDLLADFM